MDVNRIEQIRQEEKEYHEYCYENYKLFEQGSWLHKPVKTVMDLLVYFKESVSVLDLGCGVGRNSIPIAQQLSKGSIACVDLLESAIEKLREYSKQFNVESFINLHQTDIVNYWIEPNAYDYIIDVSSLEHVDSEDNFINVLRRMEKGTKINGINCIIVNSEVEEIDVETGVQLDTYMEVNLSTEQMMSILKSVYSNWEEIVLVTKPLTYEIVRRKKRILLKTKAITFVSRKR